MVLPNSLFQTPKPPLSRAGQSPRASALLRKGGLLLISTPDVGSVFARLSGKRWHYYNEYHLSYFSRITIRRLAAEAGLREVGFTRLPRLKSLGCGLFWNESRRSKNEV